VAVGLIGYCLVGPQFLVTSFIVFFGGFKCEVIHAVKIDLEPQGLPKLNIDTYTREKYSQVFKTPGWQPIVGSIGNVLNRLPSIFECTQ